jgi:hypothetical protein
MITKARSLLRSTDIVIVVVAAIAILVAGCTDADSAEETSPTTTINESVSSDDGQALVFGSGEVPSTVPVDFPIPEEAVIGSTMIDRTRGRTELITTYPANVPDVVEFYETNLPARGYAVDSSSGTDAKWIIDFSSGETTGQVVIATGGSGLSQGTLVFIIPVAG